MRAMDRSIAWRAALLQALLVAAVAVALAVALPRSFFEDWGWLAGPGAWGVCALVVAGRLRLPPGWSSSGAGLSGLLILPGVFSMRTGWARRSGWPLRRVVRVARGRRTCGGGVIPRVRSGRARHGRVEGHRARDRRRADRRGREGGGRLELARSGSRRPRRRSARGATCTTPTTRCRPGPDRRRSSRPRPDRHLRRQHRRPAARRRPARLHARAVGSRAPHPRAVADGDPRAAAAGDGERGFGRIVAVGSIAVREPIDQLQLSNSHRPGLLAAFKVLARQHAATA